MFAFMFVFIVQLQLLCNCPDQGHYNERNDQRLVWKNFTLVLKKKKHLNMLNKRIEFILEINWNEIEVQTILFPH